MTSTEKINAISEGLKKQLTSCEESFNETMHTLSLMKSDTKTFNEAWCALAAVSAMDHFFMRLKVFIDNNDVKMAENFIRFTVHQIEQFTDAESLNNDESTGDLVLDGKVTLHHVFKSYVEILDAE